MSTFGLSLRTLDASAFMILEALSRRIRSLGTPLERPQGELTRREKGPETT